MSDNDDTNSRQLVLNFCLPDLISFANFYAGSNQNVVDVLHNFTTSPLTSFIYLWGEHGCGLTHLLLSCCNYHHEQGIATAYIPLKDLKGSSPKILENLENMNLLCIDDLDAVAGYPHWEEALFHCFNRLQQRHCNIVVGANAAPQALPLRLPDLKSRMMSGMIYEIKQLTDEQRVAALQFRAEKLGLMLSRRAATFLLYRYSRDTNKLFALLKDLDQASLHARRSLTIPFIKQFLQFAPGVKK